MNNENEIFPSEEIGEVISESEEIIESAVSEETPEKAEEAVTEVTETVETVKAPVTESVTETAEEPVARTPEEVKPEETHPLTEAPEAEPVKKEEKTKSKSSLLYAGVAGLMILSGVLGGYVGANMVAKKFEVPAEDGTVTEQTGTHFYQTSRTYNDISVPAEKASKSVVTVDIEIDKVSNGWWQSYSYTQQGSGSGVIISRDGYILTCDHVVDDADRVYVEIGEKKYEATVIGSDALTDIAVIKIEPDGELTPATLGNSDNLKAGNAVMTIGNPLGLLSNSVSSGIVSAINRDITIGTSRMTLIQTDAAVSPGNSGGGLFDINGSLIGIVNAKYSDEDVEGIGFAIPINTALKIAEDLINTGYVASRATLGITIAEGTNGGIYVYSVVEGSAAEEVGLQYGDKILAVDGIELTEAADLSNYIAKCNPGQEIKLIIVRDGHMYEVQAILKEASETHES